jgi:hypothetical protein
MTATPQDVNRGQLQSTLQDVNHATGHRCTIRGGDATHPAPRHRAHSERTVLRKLPDSGDCSKSGRPRGAERRHRRSVPVYGARRG